MNALLCQASCSVKCHAKSVERAAWVWGAHQTHERDGQALGAVVKQPFIHDGQERVEDGAVCLEDLVNEGDRSLRQIPSRLPAVSVILQCTH